MEPLAGLVMETLNGLPMNTFTGADVEINPKLSVA